jgi:hypothetical protein
MRALASGSGSSSRVVPRWDEILNLLLSSACSDLPEPPHLGQRLYFESICPYSRLRKSSVAYPAYTMANKPNSAGHSYPQLLSSISSPSSDQPVYLICYSDPDPSTGKLWCPDCRDVQEPVKAFFSAPESPKGIIYWVGQRPEWRSPENPARVRWNVHNVPTILKLMEVSEQSQMW